LGRRQFEKVVASAPREKLQNTINTINTPVAANGGNLIVQLFAPVGSIGRVQNVYVSIPKPVGATSGNHFFYLRPGSGAGSLMQGSTTFDKDLVFNRYQFSDPAVSLEPSAAGAIITSLKDSQFDDIVPFEMSYFNSTNVIQTATLLFNISWIRRDVGAGA
jgi:hypothetical protein